MSQRKGLEIFRDVRTKLVGRGLSQPHAETYAKDVVRQYGWFIARGLRHRAHELVTDSHADEIAKLHNAALENKEAAT
ncbi:hypothetical protein APY04_0193 [Hyphomicrobium sulfonivorans]|uniref:Uncharacterized protein n=1 Tax=Hyphomicrobium sulfonivorans TaxID=121290 RepID=A0A109BP96_HYPSL|nr:hypothetical protein [Hyphomicrobium sulfonivorans]KWT72399.1 hypothetical protein APY04_0193 [Hyphomicrobium sulfonivorans]